MVSIPQQIKNILVSLAAEDKLPLDMNELDPTVFEPALRGAIFPGSMKDRYIGLDIKLDELINKKLFAQVKLDDEGVVLDVFLSRVREPIASTWKTYQEMEDGE